VQRARQAYVGFVSFWKEGDADLLPLRSARQELDKLQ
jgi:hypothetical protein